MNRMSNDGKAGGQKLMRILKIASRQHASESSLPEHASSAATPPGRSSSRPWGNRPGYDWSFPGERSQICWSYSERSCGAPCALCCRLASATPVRYHRTTTTTTTRYRHHLRPRGWPPHPAGRSPTTISSRGLNRGSAVGSGYRGQEGSLRTRTPWCYQCFPPPIAARLRGRNRRWDSSCRRRASRTPCCRIPRLPRSRGDPIDHHFRCSIGVRDRVRGRFCAPSALPLALPLSGLQGHRFRERSRHAALYATAVRTPFLFFLFFLSFLLHSFLLLLLSREERRCAHTSTA